MSKTVQSIIKLRADTISNWLTNSSTTLQDKELSIIKYNDGSVGLKLGTGQSYANTDLLKFNQVVTNTISDGTNTYLLPDSSGKLSLLINLYSKFQMIKPNFSQSSHVKLFVSINPDFNTTLFSIDSRTDYSKFKGYSISGQTVQWNNITSGGFGIEYNNLPVLVDFSQDLSSSNFELTNSTILYVKYYWYYIDDNQEEHKSDYYSAVLPSNTEVGANSQDVVNKQEFLNSMISKADKSYVDDQLLTKIDSSYADQVYAPISVVSRVGNLETLVGSANSILEEV